jgi:hypothetical protein
MSTQSQSGSKTQYIRDALNELGLDANFAETAKWVKNKHGVEIPDPIFYTTRKEMRRLAKSGDARGTAGEAAAPATAAEAKPTAAEAKPAAAKATRTTRGPQKKKAAARTAKKPAPVAAAPKTKDNVADLVYKAQALVQHLGKTEAKKLIDVL